MHDPIYLLCTSMLFLAKALRNLKHSTNTAAVFDTPGVVAAPRRVFLRETAAPSNPLASLPIVMDTFLLTRIT